MEYKRIGTNKFYLKTCVDQKQDTPIKWPRGLTWGPNDGSVHRGPRDLVGPSYRRTLPLPSFLSLVPRLHPLDVDSHNSNNAQYPDTR